MAHEPIGCWSAVGMGESRSMLSSRCSVARFHGEGARRARPGSRDGSRKVLQFLGYALFSSSSFVVQHRAVIGCIRERRMPKAAHHLSVCFHASTRAEGWKPEHENQPGTLRIQAARCEAEPPSLAAAF